MAMQIPKERTYYYECTEKKVRLLHWIPVNVLRDMVNKGKAKKAILRDYPHGLDIKVSRDVFDEFRKKYSLVLDVDPEDVWKAFRALWLKEKKSFLGSGYIKRTYLEPLAKKIHNDMEGAKPPRPIISKKPKNVKQRKKVFMSQTKIDRDTDEFLEKLKVPDFKKRKPVQEQSISKVKLTKGKEPLTVFKALQRRKRGKE